MLLTSDCCRQEEMFHTMDADRSGLLAWTELTEVLDALDQVTHFAGGFGLSDMPFMKTLFFTL